MIMHLKKLSVGTVSFKDLVQKQKQRKEKGFKNIHLTRNFPKRWKEIINGGSIYWVIKSKIQARQEILDIKKVKNNEGKTFCGLYLSDKIIRVWPTKVKIFQGWRYLNQNDVPSDVEMDIDLDDKKNQIYFELKEIGLL